jgi:hypothetical protein
MISNTNIEEKTMLERLKTSKILKGEFTYGEKL